MTSTGAPNPASEIETLMQEIAKLRHLQHEALKIASYVGMTRQEGAEYDARHSRIMTLTAQLRGLQTAQQNN
ncbi:MAG TPA: hypothetical protein VGS05_09480 [Candidatus Sulfotelmatobacter sp.]|nr:hypothetical protein [Candidatus Sulfotelmatobacter sp.]